jgi:Ion transport protein.
MITKPSQTEAAKRLNPLEIITLILSIYVLVALLIERLISLPPDAVVLLDRIDCLICIVFLTDFFVRFTRAPSKLGFLKWGWIDFVSSIPVVGVFGRLDVIRAGRVVRIIRVVRLLRAFRSTKNLLGYLLRERKITSLTAATTVSLVLVIFAAIGVLQFETTEPGSNIKTAGDAFWWAFATVTTVGYGDRYPVSPEGRIVACIVMAIGVGLFGSFTGFIASLFVQPELNQDESAHERVLREMRSLDTKISSLDAKLNELKNSSVTTFPLQSYPSDRHPGPPEITTTDILDRHRNGYPRQNKNLENKS